MPFPTALTSFTGQGGTVLSLDNRVVTKGDEMMKEIELVSCYRLARCFIPFDSDSLCHESRALWSWQRRNQRTPEGCRPTFPE
jgi:hypothetical protein